LSSAASLSASSSHGNSISENSNMYFYKSPSINYPQLFKLANFLTEIAGIYFSKHLKNLLSTQTTSTTAKKMTQSLFAVAVSSFYSVLSKNKQHFGFLTSLILDCCVSCSVPAFTEEILENCFALEFIRGLILFHILHRNDHTFRPSFLESTCYNVFSSNYYNAVVTNPLSIFHYVAYHLDNFEKYWNLKNKIPNARKKESNNREDSDSQSLDSLDKKVPLHVFDSSTLISISTPSSYIEEESIKKSTSDSSLSPSIEVHNICDFPAPCPTPSSSPSCISLNNSSTFTVSIKGSNPLEVFVIIIIIIILLYCCFV
jgi:hypothetical protein